MASSYTEHFQLNQWAAEAEGKADRAQLTELSARVERAEQAAENIGIAFQIQDDILDVTSSLEVLGKPVGSDEKNHKVTYVRLNGLEQSKKDVEALSEEALKILSSFDRRNEFLEDLVRALITREK